MKSIAVTFGDKKFIQEDAMEVGKNDTLMICFAPILVT